MLRAGGYGVRARGYDARARTYWDLVGVLGLRVWGRGLTILNKCKSNGIVVHRLKSARI